jgi:H+/Cl- antiporter ClcA
MVPLMLAVAGASVVTRLFERRSIYTVRVARNTAGGSPTLDVKLSTSPLPG